MMDTMETMLSHFSTLPLFTKISMIGLAGMFLLAVIVRLGTRSHGAVASRPPVLGRLAMCGMFLSALALAGSGYGGPLVKDAPLVGGVARMGGWFLMGHMVFAGLFIASLSGVALFSSESCRFGTAPAVPGSGPRKFFFWSLVALGLATVLTALIGMTPLMGSAEVGLLTEVHRWTAMTLLLALMGYLVSR